MKISHEGANIPGVPTILIVLEAFDVALSRGSQAGSIAFIDRIQLCTRGERNVGV